MNSDLIMGFDGNSSVVLTNYNLTVSSDRDEKPVVGAENIYPALIECFGIISLGYLAGRYGKLKYFFNTIRTLKLCSIIVIIEFTLRFRFNLFSEKEAKGLGTFVGTFALPAMIFTALCTLDLSSVNWKFVLSILITKAVLFLLVLLISLLVNRGNNIGKAGLYSIFVTQSNDFALGYPILNALYDQTHPEYPSYLYLLAPISLAILNPIGCIFMEIDKVKKSTENESVEEMEKMVIKNRTKNIFARIGVSEKSKTICKIFFGILSNPIIILTFAGIIFGQFIFHGNLPPLINNLLQTLKSSYSAIALFSLGLGMVGKMKALKNGSKLLGPFILIASKVMLMPLLAREITNLLYAGSNEEECNDLANFAFLYGTFPTAPTVYVLATRYGIASGIIATTMIACTFVSAPIMFISGKKYLPTP